MAGDEWAVPLLLGLGLDEFSMSAPTILKTRAQVKTLEKQVWQQVAERALTYATADDVLALVKETLA
jgi:phosphoenolpyruvate-protein phosphotransferase (PTS system enzyme I)